MRQNRPNVEMFYPTVCTTGASHHHFFEEHILGPVLYPKTKTVCWATESKSKTDSWASKSESLAF